VPGPASFNTPDRIIREAMRNAKLIGKGEDPSSEDYAEYMPRLNDLINVWQTQGLKLWLQTDLSVTLVAGTALYTFGTTGTVVMTKPTRVVQAYYLDSSDNRRPLLVLSRDEYTRLSNVVNQGQINSYYVDKQQATLNVYFWLTPDSDAATGTAHLIIQQQVTNIVSLNDTMNFPPEWFLALHWGLANEICSGQPQSIIDRCEKMSNQYRTALEDWDVEDASTSFAPDQRNTYETGRFR
jgi:hypothetical protein